MGLSEDRPDDITEAELALLEFLRLEEADAVPDFDAFCADRPRIAKELRALRDAGALLSGLLREGEGGFSLARVVHLTAPDDPEVSLGSTSTDVDAGSFTDLLDRLRTNRPRQSHYLLEGQLARGGMGVILKAYDESLQRTLAMKVILGEEEAEPAGDTPASDHRSLGRFLEEAQITGQLEHPGIVPVHELGIDEDGRVFFTMRLVRGRELRAILDLAREGKEGWSVTRVLSVLLRVCEAMAFAHDKGVVHRDLKPSNIMVGSLGETYVMDWGLARVLGRRDRKKIGIRPPKPPAAPDATAVLTDRAMETPGGLESPLLTLDGDVVGTPAYMPPEQAKGRIREVGKRSDVYSVGAILYQLLTGVAPYAGQGAAPSPYEVLRRVMEGPPAPLRTLNSRLPAELEAICDKAMARQMEDRYPAMEALADDLRAYLEHRVVAAYESGPIAELRKWVGRNRGIAVTAAAVLLFVGALSAWSLARVREERSVARVNARWAMESARVAEQGRLAAERERNQADRDTADLERLADVSKLSDLRERMDELWPARPELAVEMRRWLETGRGLLERRPLHEETLRKLRARGRSVDHPRQPELARLLQQVASLREQIRQGIGSDERDVSAGRLALLEAEASELASTIRAEPVWLFESVSDAWWHEAEADYLAGLANLGSADDHTETIASMEARLAFAETVHDRSIQSRCDQWLRAMASITDPDDCPKYSRLVIEPQVGLVPLGRNPRSGLWEFWHLQTGERPRRDGSGRWTMDEQTGLVFVLVPGGTFLMGAQAERADAPNYDPQAEDQESDPSGRPVEVTLDPFFLSKFEVTQAQWRRMTGTNPSHWWAMAPDLSGPRYPLENASWEECDRALRRLGLVLPTEAQWERACRAGTDTVWSSGNSLSSLARHANIADHMSTLILIDPEHEHVTDGWALPAPVGSLRPNDFGFFDMHGNVEEWCRDQLQLGGHRVPLSEGDGALQTPGLDAHRIRGGAYGRLAVIARSACRRGLSSNVSSFQVGLRPALKLDP